MLEVATEYGGGGGEASSFLRLSPNSSGHVSSMYWAGSVVYSGAAIMRERENNNYVVAATLNMINYCWRPTKSANKPAMNLLWWSQRHSSKL